MSMPMNTGRSAGQNMSGMRTGYNPNFTVGQSKGGLRPVQMQNFTPEIMKLFEQLQGHLGPDSFLSKLAGGDQSQFEQMEAPAMRQFQEMQGGIASRFSGMGSGGRRSSGFRNTMNQATSDFAQDLQSKRMDIQRNSLKDLMGMGQMLMEQKPFENKIMQKNPSFWHQFLNAIMQNVGQVGSTAANAAVAGAMA